MFFSFGVIRWPSIRSSFEEHFFLRKIFFMAFVVSVVAVLSSCGARSSVSDGAPRAAEESVSEEATVGEETEAEIPTPVANVEIEPTQNTVSTPAVAGSGMVSSANPYATRAGVEILEEGGNAFDASVAVAAALGVTEPMMSGIGGYGAIVVYDAEEGRTRFLNTGYRTPAALDPEVFRPTAPNFAENRCGAKSVATPGNVRAWEALSEEYGELEWRRLFEPAIELAGEGFPVDGITASWIEASWSVFPEHARKIYGNGGSPMEEGETLVQEDLMRSLSLIAEGGAEVVYEGELGEAIDAAVRENNGFLTLDDLRHNRVRWQDTVSIDHRGYEVATASPPATSWGALLRLGTMGQFDFEASDHNSAEYLHAFAEVGKQAGQATRDYVADPEIATTPLDYLLSEDLWADIASKVNPSQASPTTPFGTFGAPTRCVPQSYTSPGLPVASPSDTPASAPGEQGGPSAGGQHTTHFVVADGEGNVVSATQSLGNIFGSKVMPEGTGIWLNDALAWSRFEPAGNVFDVFPSRQSLYALCPTIVMSDGRPVVAIGTPGGRTIIQTTPQMLMNLIDFDMDIQQAISAPRVSTTTNPNALLVEAGLPQSVRGELAALGHNVRIDERGLGNAHGLTIEYGSDGKPLRFTGGSDPRGVGAAAGY